MDSEKRTIRDEDDRSAGPSSHSGQTRTLSGTGVDAGPPDESDHVYNLMVAGQRTGKTSFLRLLLDTCRIAPTATPDQLASVAKFVQGCSGHTAHVRTAAIDTEVELEGGGPPQPLTLSLIDTPSLDFQDPALSERLVSDMLRLIDSRLAEGMNDVGIFFFKLPVHFRSSSRPTRNGHPELEIITFICTCLCGSALGNVSNSFAFRCIYFLDPDHIVPPSVPGPPAALLPRNRGNSFSQNEQEPVFLEPPVTTNPLLCRPMLPATEINTIRRLSARVNVLPVIARTDTLTNDRLAAVKVAVRRGLAEAGIGFGIFDVDTHLHFPHHIDTALEYHTMNGDTVNGYSRHKNRPNSPSPAPSLLQLPFALISPDVYAHNDGVSRPALSRHELVRQYTPSSSDKPLSKLVYGRFTRSYRWGSLDVLNPHHCDFLPLRTAIFHHMKVRSTFEAMFVCLFFF